QRLTELASSAEKSLSSNPFGGDSKFAKTLKSSLSTEQAARFDAVQEIRRVSGKVPRSKSGSDAAREVDLSITRFADDGMPLISLLNNMQVLNLDSSRVTDTGLVHLRSLTELRGLDLGSTDVSDAGLWSLEALTKLETLNLRSTKVTDAALRHLRGLTELRQ